MPQNPFRDPAVSVDVNASTDSFNSAMDGAIRNLNSFKGAVGAARLALGALAKATDAAASYEEAMIGVEKVTTPETAREMSDAIQGMAEEIPQTQGELAEIAEIAGRLGADGAENIENFTRATAEIATATDLASEQAADSFARIATLANEPIDNIRSLGDVVNELSNSMGALASEITDAMTRSAGALTQLGLAASEIAGLSAAMSEVLSILYIAGIQLRRFAQEIQNPKKAEDFASALGMSVDVFEAMREKSPNELIRRMAERFGEGGKAADALGRCCRRCRAGPWSVSVRT